MLNLILISSTIGAVTFIDTKPDTSLLEFAWMDPFVVRWYIVLLLTVATSILRYNNALSLYNIRLYVEKDVWTRIDRRLFKCISRPKH